MLWLLFAVIALGLAGCSGKRVVTGSQLQQVTPGQIIPSDRRQVDKLIAEARKWIGTPYAYGGHSRKGTDCSGFTMELFLKVYNLKLPRSSAMQQQYAHPLERDELEPGDLVFFATGKSRKRVSHVGIYVGNGRMIHASASRGVMESGIGQSYWVKNYHSSGRVIESDPSHRQQTTPAIAPRHTDIRLQELYDALDSQIDSIYVSDPEIFD